MLTRTSRSLRTVRTGFACHPPACCTYQRHRAACPRGTHGNSRTSLGHAVRTAYGGTPGLLMPRSNGKTGFRGVTHVTGKKARPYQASNPNLTPTPTPTPDTPPTSHT